MTTTSTSSANAASNAVDFVLNNVRSDIADLESILNASVLDGTPYAVTIVNPKHGTMVYGEWESHNEGRACFRPLSVIANHLCGVFFMDAFGAQKAVKKLIDAGDKTANYAHRRQITEDRLAASKAMLAKIEASVAAQAQAQPQTAQG